MEAITVDGDIQWAPFGRTCTWTDASGSPSLSLGPGPEGWGPTVLIVGTSTMFAVSTGASLAKTISQRSRGSSRAR